MVSILLCTIDRYDLTVKCVGKALATAGYAYELLSVDNGSTDMRVVDYVASLNPAYHRLNSMNEGYAPMLNQMLLRAKGEYLCVIDNDIELPEAWLRLLVEANQKIVNSGISGIHCICDLLGVTEENGVRVHFQGPYGIKFFNRAVLDKIGYYWEEYSPYGNEDVEMHIRVKMAGFRSYYLAGYTSVHHGNDVGEQSAYRKMKWASLERASVTLARRQKYFDDTGDYYVGPPDIR